MRLYGGIYVALGISWTIGSLIVALAGVLGPPVLAQVLAGGPFTFLIYGLMYLTGGVVVLWLGPRLAKFAAKP
jgi:hypothetical protein